MHSTGRIPEKRRGLTVLETVFALALLAVMLLSLSALFLKLLSSSEKGADQQAGLLLAERILSDITRRGEFSSMGQRSGRQLYNHDASAVTEFTYQVTCTSYQVDPPDSPNIYFVDVHVWWMGDQRAGQGQLHTQLSRLVTP